MWDSIKLITSMFTLLAFITTCIVSIIRININTKKNILVSANEEDRGTLIKRYLEFFDVDTNKLNNKEKFDVIMFQIQEKSKRHLRIVITTIILSIIFAVFSIIAIAMEKITDIEDKIIEIPEII